MHQYSWKSGAARIHTQTGSWPSAGPDVMDNTDCIVKTRSDVEIRILPACNNSASMSPRDSYIPSVINTNSRRGCDSLSGIHHIPEIQEKTAICTKPRLCLVVLNQNRVICVQRSNGMTLLPLVVVRSLIDTNTQYLTRVIPSKEEDHFFRGATKLAGMKDYPKLPVLVLLNEIMQCTGKPDMEVGNVTARWQDALKKQHDVIEPLRREQNLRASTISTGPTKTQEDLPPPLIDASSATFEQIQRRYKTHQAGPRPRLLSSSDKLTTSPAGSLLRLDSQLVNKQNLRSHLKKQKNKQVLDQVLSAPIASQPSTVHPLRPYGKPQRPARSTGASTVKDFNPSLPLINFPAHSVPTTAPIFSHSILHTILSMQPAATSTGIDNGLLDNRHVPTASHKSNIEFDHRRHKLIDHYHEPLNRTQHGNSQMSNSPKGNAHAANPPVNRSHHGNTNISSSHYGNPQRPNSYARAANPEISRSSHGNTHTSNFVHGNADVLIPAHGSTQINRSSHGDAQISNYHYGNARESISAHQANGSSQINRSGPSNARMFSPQHDNIQVSRPVCDSLPMSCYRRGNEHVNSSRLDNTPMSSCHHDNTPMSSCHHDNTPMSGPQLDNTQLVVSQLDYAHVTESQLLSCQHANEQETSSLHDHTQLTGHHLDYTQLNGPHLDYTQLTGPNLANTQLIGPHLDNMQLTSPHLDNTQLIGPHLDKTQLNGPHLDNTQLNGPHLDHTQLTSPHLDNTQLTSPHLDNTQLTSPHLDNTQLTSPHLENTQVAGSLDNYTQLTGSPFDTEQINSSPHDSAQINGLFIKEEDADSSLSNPLSSDPGHQRPQQQTPRDSTFSQLALPSKSDGSSPKLVKPEKSPPALQVHPLAPELTDIISLSSTTPARLHSSPPPAPPSAATELHQSPPITTVKKEPHQITSLIRPVMCRDRSISCLVKDGEQYALVEALCRVFFCNHTVDLLIKICTDINGTHLKEVNKTEEKLFIDYFGLNVDKLICNKVFPIDKFDTYLGHIEYMLGYWTEKPEIKTENCDGDVEVIEITNCPPPGSSSAFSIMIDD